MLKFLFLLALCVTSAQALVLEDLIKDGKLQETLSNKKVGYYIGSFDPLHLGHQDTAQIPLDQNLVDYVLIFPNWGGDNFKNRAPIEARLEMLFSVFKDHPHIIVTKLSPKEMQEHLTLPDPSHSIAEKPAVTPAFTDVKFIGIIGSDTANKLAIPQEDPKKEEERKKHLSVYMRGIQITDKHARDTAGGVIALPIDAFIVAQREGDDLSALKGKVDDRTILSMIQSKAHPHASSTLVKKTLKAGQSVDHMVDPGVLQIIQENKLYQ